MTQQPPPDPGWPASQPGSQPWQQSGGAWSEAPPPPHYHRPPHAEHQSGAGNPQWGQPPSDAGWQGTTYTGTSTPAAAPSGSLPGLRSMAQLAVPVLVVIALLLTEGGDQNAFETLTAWSIFAVVMALVQLASLVGGAVGLGQRTAWTVGAVGTAGLVGYWVIIALPSVSSNAGFLLTLAAALAVIGCWLSPGRRM